jgi:putative transposase
MCSLARGLGGWGRRLRRPQNSPNTQLFREWNDPTLTKMRTPRRHRININEAGHAHALTFSCYRRFTFLSAERTCAWLADAIEAAREAKQFAVWAYVFMPEHAHVVVFPHDPEHNVAMIRKVIKSPVAKQAIQFLKEHAPDWIPRITRNRGARIEHLFWQSGGGYDRNLTNPKTLLATIDYIHMNPVRRGLVERATDWKWSSAGWFAGEKKCPLVPDKIPYHWLE